MAIDRTVPNTGQYMPDAINSTRLNLNQLEDDKNADTTSLDARLDVVEGGRSAANPWTQIYTEGLYLGGVLRTSWPTASSGSFGQVVYGGSVTLNGTAGITVNHGLTLTPTSTAYQVIITCNDYTKLGKIGEIAYTKSATSVIIYNSGEANITCDISIIDLNP